MDAWSVLERSGMPDGVPRGTGALAFDAADVRIALAQLARGDSTIPEGAHEALLAWLGALRHHWPERYDEIAGAAGIALEGRLQPTANADRYLKLRRIAIENLASLI